MFNGLFYDLNIVEIISDNESKEKIRWIVEEIEYKKVCGLE